MSNNPMKMMVPVMGIAMMASVLTGSSMYRPDPSKCRVNIDSEPQDVDVTLARALTNTSGENYFEEIITEQPLRTPCSILVDPCDLLITFTKPDYITAYDRSMAVAGQVKNVNMKMRTFNAKLTILSTPSGAEITIDSVLQSVVTPAVIYLTPGEHVVRISKEGYGNYQTSANFESGKEYELNPSLVVENQNGTVDVVSNPPGAKIFINGTDSGHTTPRSFAGPPQTLYITLKLAGYQDYTAQVGIIAGQTIPFNVTLVPDAGGSGTMFYAPDGTAFTNFDDYLNYIATHYGVLA